MAKPKAMTAAAKGYGYRWQKARAAYLLCSPLCVFCKAKGRMVAASVVDHIEPPRLGDAKRSGDSDQIANAWRLFWIVTTGNPCASIVTTQSNNGWRRAGVLAVPKPVCRSIRVIIGIPVPTLRL